MMMGLLEMSTLKSSHCRYLYQVPVKRKSAPPPPPPPQPVTDERSRSLRGDRMGDGLVKLTTTGIHSVAGFSSGKFRGGVASKAWWGFL